jgi:hypothetical protein
MGASMHFQDEYELQRQSSSSSRRSWQLLMMWHLVEMHTMMSWRTRGLDRHKQLAAEFQSMNNFGWRGVGANLGLRIMHSSYKVYGRTRSCSLLLLIARLIWIRQSSIQNGTSTLVLIGVCALIFYLRTVAYMIPLWVFIEELEQVSISSLKE